MSAASIDTELEAEISFSGDGAGAPMSQECLEWLRDNLRISVKKAAVDGEIKASSDADNILTIEEDGSLRVQRDSFITEQQDVPVPASETESGDTYLVPLTFFRINGIVLEGGSIVEVPNGGQTFDDPGYSYPADLEEFKDNLNAETVNYTWTIEGGQLFVTADLGNTITHVIQGGEDESDPTSITEVTAVEAEVPGDVTLTFNVENATNGVDYTSFAALWTVVSPGNGYDKAWISNKDNDSVTVKITKVSKVLSATLIGFTPAAKESSETF